MPMCYDDVLKRLRTIDLDAALMSLSPPDADGLCSFGNTVDFMADLWERIPVRIAHINPAMPRTRGPNTIPMSALTAWVEAEQPLITNHEGGADAVAEAIAAISRRWCATEPRCRRGWARCLAPCCARCAASATCACFPVW